MFDKKEYLRQWRLKNRDRVRAAHLRYYEKNKDAMKKRSIEWGKNNKTRRLEIARKTWAKHVIKRRAENRQWYIENKEKKNADGMRRIAQKKMAVPGWFNQFFVDEAYHLAALRSKITGFKWDVDHIVPLQSKLVCGLHWHKNLQVIPKVVNIRKSNRVWPDMP